MLLILATLGETYARSSPLHARLVGWIRRNFTPDQLGNLLIQLLDQHLRQQAPIAGDYSVDVLAVARYAVLLVDADSARPEALEKLQASLESLHGCQTRLYADRTALEWKLKLLVALLDECDGTADHAIVRTYVDPLAESALHYSLDRIESSTDYSSLCDQLSILRSFARAKGWSGKVRSISSAVNRIETIVRRLEFFSFYNNETAN